MSRLRLLRIVQPVRAVQPKWMRIWLVALICGAVLPVFGGKSLPDDPDVLRALGAALFTHTFSPKQGLGPLYNGASCVACHSVPDVGGMGPEGLAVVVRVGRITSLGFDPLLGEGGPIARAHSVSEEGFPCDLSSGVPPGANMTSIRNAPDLHGVGLIDAIPDREIAAGSVVRRDGIHGRPHWMKTVDGKVRIGRFGWKADTATLREFVAIAFRNELGITSPLAPTDGPWMGNPGRKPCLGESAAIEYDGTIVDAVSAYVASLAVPRSSVASPLGQSLFETIGCSACHTPSLASGQGDVYLYSDLLLHDLGSDLDDKVVQGNASGREWRTTPLWGVGRRLRFIHDGRARDVSEAILVHGGEAAGVRTRFRQLPPSDRTALLEFLAGL